MSDESPARTRVQLTIQKLIIIPSASVAANPMLQAVLGFRLTVIFHLSKYSKAINIGNFYFVQKHFINRKMSELKIIFLSNDAVEKLSPGKICCQINVVRIKCCQRCVRQKLQTVFCPGTVNVLLR